MKEKGITEAHTSGPCQIQVHGYRINNALNPNAKSFDE